MRFHALLVLTFAFLACAPLAAFAQDDIANATKFVDKVASQGMATIKQKQAGKLSEEQARIDFRKILNDAFDVSTIAKFTLGKYWRVATPAQQQEYTQLLKTGILDKYADRVLSYSGNGYKTNQAKAVNDTDYNVAMTLDRANEPPVDLVWRVRRIDGEFNVIDLSVEGISMSVTHRSDFASLIERNGGQVEALLKALRTKEITKGN